MINKIYGFGAMRLSFGNCNNQKAQTSPIKLSAMPFDTVSFNETAHSKAVLPSFDFEIKDVDFKNNTTTEVLGKGYVLQVHNKKIAEKILPEYTSAQFDTLFNTAKEGKTFDIKNGTGNFICTSDSSEDKNMSELIWVTDTCNFMPYLKDNAPERCTDLINKLAEFYTSPKEQKMFDLIINNPAKFQENYGRKDCAGYGVGHVFNPKTNETASHYPRTRLESVGLFLQTASDLIMKGITEEKPYGYKDADAIAEPTINAIANCTAYLNAVDYPYSKSTGPWEQWTFDVTPSSDVAVINQAFRNIIDLMYSDTENEELLKVRDKLHNSHNGKVFDDEHSLRDMLKVGEKRIRENSENEVPEKGLEDIKRCSVCKVPADAEIVKSDYQKEVSSKRGLDGAMSFIFKTEKLDETDVVKNAEKIIKRMMSWEYSKENPNGIIFDHGIVRYPKDQYLFKNQNLITNKTPKEISAIRYTDMKQPIETQAQWFMVSDVSKSYGVVAKSLMDYIKTSAVKDEEAEKLLKKAMEKETEFINRSYARITGEGTLKANGEKCPPFKVPEAYQCVEDKDGNQKFVPGINTPLTWAQVSLYDASKMMQENLKEYEALKETKGIL